MPDRAKMLKNHACAGQINTRILPLSQPLIRRHTATHRKIIKQINRRSSLMAFSAFITKKVMPITDLEVENQLGRNRIKTVL